MSTYAALIDRSEIVQKMLSHCLHYLPVEVLRFDSLEASQSHFSDKKSDIVFIDWEIKKGDEAAIYSAIEEMKPVPVVLLYRAGLNIPVDSISSSQIPYKIKKPLDPKIVRDILVKLVPQIREFKIHSFLRFPKSKEEKEKSSTVNGLKNAQNQADLIAKDFQIPVKSSQKSTLSDTAKDKAQSFFKQTFSGILTVKDKTEAQGSRASIQNKNVQNSLNQKQDLTQQDQKVKTSLFEKGKSNQKHPPLVQKERTVTGEVQNKLNKENINIDENTKNDFAPMAIKSSISRQEQSPISVNVPWSEKDILRVLNKYRDSLEFQELMEKILSEYAKKTVTNILQEDKVTDLLQQPLKEFKESQRFKEIVEQQIIQYVQKQLPLVIKEIVEQEIKNIIGD